MNKDIPVRHTEVKKEVKHLPEVHETVDDLAIFEMCQSSNCLQEYQLENQPAVCSWCGRTN